MNYKGNQIRFAKENGKVAIYINDVRKAAVSSRKYATTLAMDICNGDTKQIEHFCK